MNFESVPVKFAITEISVYVTERLQMAATVYFNAYHINGRSIYFRNDLSEISPIKLDVPKRVFQAFFSKARSLQELVYLLRKHYSEEIRKRQFKLVPYHGTDLYHWYVDIEAWRKMKDSFEIGNGSSGVVPWTELYPKGTPARKEVHLHINETGRWRRDHRKEKRSGVVYIGDC